MVADHEHVRMMTSIERRVVWGGGACFKNAGKRCEERQKETKTDGQGDRGGRGKEVLLDT